MTLQVEFRVLGCILIGSRNAVPFSHESQTNFEFADGAVVEHRVAIGNCDWTKTWHLRICDGTQQQNDGGDWQHYQEF